MCEDTADPFPSIFQREPLCCDSGGFSSRGRAVKGLSGSVAGAIVFHALLAAAVVLPPFMFPKPGVKKQCWTVSLVDSARIGGNGGAPQAAYGGPAGELSAGTPPVFPDVQSTEEKASDAAERAGAVRKIESSVWPRVDSKERIRIARQVAKIPAAVGRHGKKPSRSLRFHARYSKSVHRTPVPHGLRAVRYASGDLGGSVQTRSIKTGGETGHGAGKGVGGRAGGAPLGVDSQQTQAFPVEKPPEAVWKCEPVYPERARELGISGRVVVKFLVDTAGSVSRAFIVQAHPEGVFDQSALDAIRKWRFKPARSRGKAIGAWVILPFQFQLSRRAILSSIKG